MYKPPTKKQKIHQSVSYYTELITSVKPTAILLNVNLTSNPFLKDRDAFKYLKYQIIEYNKRCDKKQVRDTYQMASYQQLHSMLSDLAQIQTREDQGKVLEDVHAWFKEQNRLVEQRRDQGIVRYDCNKEFRDVQRVIKENQSKVVAEQKEQELEIQTHLIQKLMEPFYYGWRTSHKELDIPLRRLNQYKRKIINIAPFIETKEESKHARILYPMPVKVEEPKVQENEENKAAVEGQPGQGQPLAEGVQPPVEDPQAVNPAEQQQQDLGGFGEEPEQPQEEQPQQDGEDKLAPKNKIYIDAISEEKHKKYKESYMFYMGNDSKPERNMEINYVKKNNQSLKSQKEDANQIQIAHDWARRKSKMNKQLQKRLEEMKLKPDYSFSFEEPPKEERLSAQDQFKYGFTAAVRARPRKNEFDLSLAELPPIGHMTFHQKSIRKDRLNSLKSKFGKILNLSEQEERQSAPSLCQYTSRRRGLSEIIRNHSHSKERLHQLEEVTKIKEKLNRVKVNVNIKALSRGLCLPENEENPTDSKFPNKELPSNPFMVETKKKKKK